MLAYRTALTPPDLQFRSWPPPAQTACLFWTEYLCRNVILLRVRWMAASWANWCVWRVRAGRQGSQETRSTPGLHSGPGSDSRKEVEGWYPSLEKQFPENYEQPKATQTLGNHGHPPVETIKISNLFKSVQKVSKVYLVKTCSAFTGSDGQRGDQKHTWEATGTN